MHSEDGLQLSENLIQIFDIIARALSVLHQTEEEHFSEFYSINGFDSINTDTDNVLDRIWSKDVVLLVHELEPIVADLEREQDQSRFVKAYSIVKWFDGKFSFLTREKDKNENDEEENPAESDDYISLWELMDLNENDCLRIGALNKNYRETGIWINPKLPIRKAYRANEPKTSENERAVGNRDAFYGINNKLENMSYFKWNGKYKIQNIIMPDDNLASADAVLKVAFAPLTSKKHAIKSDSVTITRYGLEKKGDYIYLGVSEDEINDRMVNDWKFAIRNNVDIVFMPEALGTERTSGEGKDSKNWFFDLYQENMKIVGLRPPLITIWPSYWHDGENGTAITYNDGDVVGIQKKHFPYINQKNRSEEALKEYDEIEYIVIHVPNALRIAVLICSEFLMDQEARWSELLCGSIGVTLLIIPSYSPGEQDFLNKITRYTDLGTMVIWGNCCGAAVAENRAIGACSHPGTNSMEIFRRKYVCEGTCKNVKSCIFTVDIPLSISVYKQVVQAVRTDHLIEIKE